MWREGYEVVASDSKAAIRRCINISRGTQWVRSWVDEEVLESTRGGVLQLVWVRGHSGVEGNEEAGNRAKEAARGGKWMLDPSIAIPAGIRLAYPLYTRTPQLEWDREALRGLTYLHIDRGLMRV